MERVDALVKSHVDVIVVDSAHGHSKNILEAVKKIKAAYPDLQIIAGNIATGAAAKALIEAGADAVRLVSDLVLSVPHVSLPVSVYHRLQLSWTVTRLLRSMEFLLSQMVVSSTQVI